MFAPLGGFYTWPRCSVCHVENCRQSKDTYCSVLNVETHCEATDPSGPSWNYPSTWSLLTEPDTMILMQRLWLCARLMTPARSRSITPTVREPHHRGLCPACSCHINQDSSPTCGDGWHLNTIYTPAFGPTDSGHTTVNLKTHTVMSLAGWILFSLTMICPWSKATPSVLLVCFNIPHVFLDTNLQETL